MITRLHARLPLFVGVFLSKIMSVVLIHAKLWSSLVSKCVWIEERKFHIKMARKNGQPQQVLENVTQI